MEERLKRLRSKLQVTEVHETAACARALTALVGTNARAEIRPGGAHRMTQAALTARVIAARDQVPWPAAIMRQLDPNDPAFLPPIGLHPVWSGRDRTQLGIPGREGKAWVDPFAWCGVGDGPSVTVWFGDGRTAFPVGRRPEETRGAVEVHQCRGEQGFGVRTTCRRGSLRLELFHWTVVLDGRVAWAIHATLHREGLAPRPARLGFAVRPVGLDGIAPIFQLERDAAGLWRADGHPIMAVGHNGDELLTGVHGQPDPWRRFAGLAHAGPPSPVAPTTLHCSKGLCSVVETYRTTLSPDVPFSRLVVLAPAERASSFLVRTSRKALEAGASADWSGLLASGAEIKLERHQGVLDACRNRLLLEPERAGMPAFLGAVALARMGFTRRAGTRIANWLHDVRWDGAYRGTEPEDGAVLAWAAAQYVRTTGDTGWLEDNLSPWRRLLSQLVRVAPKQGGHSWFGLDGSARWSAIWRAAALLASAVVLRGHAKEQMTWAVAGARERELLPGSLGPAPWSASPSRAPDGSAAGMLAACWLGLISHGDEDLRATADHICAHHLHGGGVLLGGGAHSAATALLEVVLERMDPQRDPLGNLARLASPTGALPTARHPDRGALGEGDDLLGAAMFALVALDRVQVAHGNLTLLPGMKRCRNLPTPLGRIDVDGEQVTGRWRGHAPKIQVLSRPSIVVGRKESEAQ